MTDTTVHPRHNTLTDLHRRIVETCLAEAAKREDESRRLTAFIQQRRDRAQALAAGANERRHHHRLLTALGVAPTPSPAA